MKNLLAPAALAIMLFSGPAHAQSEDMAREAAGPEDLVPAGSQPVAAEGDIAAREGKPVEEPADTSPADNGIVPAPAARAEKKQVEEKVVAKPVAQPVDIQPATITLKPHNSRFDGARDRHDDLLLTYMQQSAEVDRLVNRSLDVQHRMDQIRTDMRMTKRMLEDTRSRKARTRMEENLLKSEKDLAALGDELQLVNIDLQNALQKQQQTLQTISNVSKLMHDTAMAIIRKMGG
jgi:hypothetical protein